MKSAKKRSRFLICHLLGAEHHWHISRLYIVLLPRDLPQLEQSELLFGARSAGISAADGGRH